MDPRILIVGTVPYNVKSTSRAFDAYFHGWDRMCLAQVFSNTKRPCKGHCDTMFQITDARLVKRWLGKKVQTGIIYNYDELDVEWTDNDLEVSQSFERAYQIGGKHTPLMHLLRGVLWRKKFWCTPELNAWLDAFQPECVFLSFSNDYFINHIALYVARRYNIPIVSSIGDDYYFNGKFSLNPIYHLYKETYRALIRRVLRWRGSAIYISDKIRDKYCESFGISGETVYLTSDVLRKQFAPIDQESPLITYFGNIRMGRNLSLCDIADALVRINPSYCLEVYSNEQDPAVYGVFDRCPNLKFGGSIPYAAVKEKMQLSDVTVVVEGFRPEDINLSRYSLSTKAADALASGAAILTYGSADCGVVSYMESTGAASVCTDKAKLEDLIRDLLTNEEQHRQRYDRAIEVTQAHHMLERSCETFRRVVARAVE